MRLEQPQLIVSGNHGQPYLLSGDVIAGSDGNVYLLRGGSPTLIYIISPAGEVIRKLHIEVGKSDLVASSIKSYAGQLAIGFAWQRDLHENLIKVIDVKGNSIADYELGMSGFEYSPSLALLWL